MRLAKTVKSEIDLKQAFGMEPGARLVIGAGDLDLRSGFDRFVANRN